MDLSDTRTVGDWSKAAEEGEGKDNNIEVCLERIKLLQKELKESNERIEELIKEKENDSRFTLEENGDVMRSIKDLVKQADDLISKTLGKTDLKFDDLNLINGVIMAVEKYRTMKLNVYSMTKFKYPTG